MFLKCTTNGDVTRLYFCESYYIPPEPGEETGRVCQRVVRDLGTLEELSKCCDDPVAHFTEEARRLSHSGGPPGDSWPDWDAPMSESGDEVRNLGYCVINRLYYQLELDRFWREHQVPELEWDTLSNIFRLLVIYQTLFPGSGCLGLERKSAFFEPTGSFSPEEISLAQAVISRHQDALQKWIFDHTQTLVPRDLSLSFYNISTCCIDSGGDYPFTGIALHTDRNGIPLAYDPFDGSDFERVHTPRVATQIGHDFSDSRLVLVLDRGPRVSNTVVYLNREHPTERGVWEGYVYAHCVGNADGEFRSWAARNSEGDCYVPAGEGRVEFPHKSRIHSLKLSYGDADKDDQLTMHGLMTDQKQLVFYSDAYAKKQRMERAAMVARATVLMENPDRYNSSSVGGSAAYLKGLAFDPETGAIANEANLSLDRVKIEEEAGYDGCYALVTSELEMPDGALMAVYRRYQQFEQSFRIFRESYGAQPEFKGSSMEIGTHFAVCYTALVLTCILEAKLDHRFPTETILHALRKYACLRIAPDLYQTIYYDQVLRSCEEAFGLDLKRKYRTLGQIRALLQPPWEGAGEGHA